jgi:hypothetical protein
MNMHAIAGRNVCGFVNLEWSNAWLTLEGTLRDKMILDCQPFTNIKQTCGCTFNLKIIQ